MKEFDSSQPIYLQLAQRISRRIVRNELRPGEKLPSVRETAVEWGVNPNTVQRTFQELERMGIVETRRGQGTFVTEQQDILDRLRARLKEEQIESFVRDMTELGFTPEEITRGLQEFLQSHFEKGASEHD